MRTGLGLSIVQTQLPYLTPDQINNTKLRCWLDGSYSVNAGGARWFTDRSYFVAAHAAALDLGTSDGLYSVWVYLDTTGQSPILCKYQDADNYVLLEVSASRKAHFLAKAGGATIVEITGASTLETGQIGRAHV